MQLYVGFFFFLFRFFFFVATELRRQDDLRQSTFLS